MSWGALLGAIALDVAATFALTASDGFRTLWPSVLGIVAFLGSIYLFGLAIAGLGPSVSYAMFGAIGTTSVAVIAMAWQGEPATWGRVGALTLIVVGVTLLPIAGSH
jgi:multidrug transporter EmrE-like cation transporter